MSSTADSSSTGYCYSNCECYYCVSGTQRSPHPPSWRVFIGNINFRATHEQLEAFLSPCGNLKSVKISHRGFGFAKFTEKESALKAIADFHRKVFMGRKLKVQKDKWSWDSDDE